MLDHIGKIDDGRDMTPLPTLRQLQFFIALARRHSFSRAAEDCFVSQSTLSAGIKELETVLDVVLVDRTSRSFALTPSGETIVEQAVKILARTEDMVRSANRTAPLTGVLKLGVIPTIAPFMLPMAMTLFDQEYQDLSLYLREDLTLNLINQLRSGQIDLALMAFPYEAEGLEMLVFHDDPFFFVCTPEHRFAKRKQLNTDDLEGEELLLLEDGHCLRDHALSACRLQVKEVAKTFGGTSLFTLAQMTRSGLGTTLMPEMAIKQGLAQTSALQAIPFKSTRVHKKPARQIGLAWRRGSGLQADAQAMADVFLRALQSTEVA